MRRRAKDGGALLDSGCPTSWRQENERQFEHGANTSISHTTHAFIHGRRLNVIPLKRVIRGGSQLSREVVVHGS